MVGVLARRSEDRGHHLSNCASLRRAPFRSTNCRCPAPDQGESEHVDIGIGHDAAQVALDGEVGGDHGGGVCRQRDTGRPGLAQPGAQLVAEDDEGDDRQATDPNRSVIAPVRLSAKCRCRNPLAQPASVVTARLVSAFGPVAKQDALGGVEQLAAHVAADCSGGIIKLPSSGLGRLPGKGTGRRRRRGGLKPGPCWRSGCSGPKRPAG